jgi:transcriptional regulator with XRE-family HTH domain
LEVLSHWYQFRYQCDNVAAMDAGKVLRSARQAARLSLRELAERAETSHATLAAYEAGRIVPRVDTLDRILRAAGYASDIELDPRADATRQQREAKGEELRQVLELAAHFPARHGGRLTAPRFGRHGRRR